MLRCCILIGTHSYYLGRNDFQQMRHGFKALLLRHDSGCWVLCMQMQVL